MPKNTLNDLRDHLFEVIEKLEVRFIEVTSGERHSALWNDEKKLLPPSNGNGHK